MKKNILFLTMLFFFFSVAIVDTDKSYRSTKKNKNQNYKTHNWANRSKCRENTKSNPKSSKSKIQQFQKKHYRNNNFSFQEDE